MNTKKPHDWLYGTTVFPFWMRDVSWIFAKISSFFLLAVLAWEGGDFMVFAILVLDIPVYVFQEFPQSFPLFFSVI